MHNEKENLIGDHKVELSHLEKSLKREKEIYDRTMKSLSVENRAALKDLMHEHAAIEKELRDEVEELSSSVMSSKIMFANLLTTQNEKVVEYESTINRLNNTIQY